MHQSVRPFLSGEPSPKKNPGSPPDFIVMFHGYTHVNCPWARFGGKRPSKLAGKRTGVNRLTFSFSIPTLLI